MLDQMGMRWAEKAGGGTLRQERVRVSHTRMVLSQEPENRCLSPTASTRTLSSCPSSVLRHCSVALSHTCSTPLFSIDVHLLF